MWFSCVDGSSVHYINQRRPMFVLSISFTIFLLFQNIFLIFQNAFVNISESIFFSPLYQSGKTDNCWLKQEIFLGNTNPEDLYRPPPYYSFSILANGVFKNDCRE